MDAALVIFCNLYLVHDDGVEMDGGQLVDLIACDAVGGKEDAFCVVEMSEAAGIAVEGMDFDPGQEFVKFFLPMEQDRGGADDEDSGEGVGLAGGVDECHGLVCFS